MFHCGNGHLGTRTLQATARSHGLRLTNDLPCESCIVATGRRRVHIARRHARRHRRRLYCWTSRGRLRLRMMGHGTWLCLSIVFREGARSTACAPRLTSSRTFKYSSPTSASRSGLRMDNTGENTSRRFVPFCDNNSIRREYTAPHTGQNKAPVDALARANRRPLCSSGHSTPFSFS